MSKNHGHLDAECQQRLGNEFARLKRILGIPEDLTLEWTPRKVLSKSGKELSGEVIGNVVLIYEEDCKEAVKTLRHELMDFCVSWAIEPYRDVTNRLIRMINEDAYNRKEKIVESLTRLMGKIE